MRRAASLPYLAGVLGGLGRRRYGVLEVEDHHVGTAGECLATALSKRAKRSPGGSGHKAAACHEAGSPGTSAQEWARARCTSWAAITLRWISLVPSPTIISGASRK